MNRIGKALLSPAFHSAFWALMNRRNDHRVESWAVSRKAQIGFRSIIRKGVEVGADVELGDFSYISGPDTYVESARIGRFCSIARRTVIGVSGKDMARVTTHNFPSSPAYGGLTHETRLPRQKPAPVIGHDVWIGINAVILRGVTIGHGAVIGANSVVSRDVPPYAVVGGNPARYIRDRFPPDQAAALLRISWWNWDRHSLSACSAEFLDAESFIRRHDPAPAWAPQEA